MKGMTRCAAIGMVAVTASNSFATMILTAMVRPQVGLVAQCNIVVWDPVTKIEHLVQSSALMSQAKRFEFLVPTPTIPQVQEVGDAPINFVSALITPPRPIQPVVKPNPDDELDSTFGILIRPKPEVKQIAFVGNLKATTLRASDVVALSDWMEKNGYQTNAAQKAWLEKYVQKRWFITAFQVNSESDAIKTSSVRLSFKTELPFVPYTSPRNSWVSGIRQEVFLVTPAPMQGTTDGKSLWSGRQTGHTFLKSASIPDFAKKLGVASKNIPAQSWVSRFVDNSSDDKVLDDLYFLNTPKGTKKKP